MRIDDWFALEIFAIRFTQPQITELRPADAHSTFQHGLEDGPLRRHPQSC
jgi:hypothetical protein